MSNAPQASEATLSHMRERVRLELGDQAIPFTADFFTDGIEVQFRIDFRPLKMDSLVLTLDGVPSTEYTVDARHGVIMFPEVHPKGVVVNVAGVKFKYFHDEDLNVFCKESIAEHSNGQLDLYGVQMTLSRIPVVQHHPIALRATVLALWTLVSDAAFDIDIFAPDGVNIPRSQRFSQLMELIGAKQGEYDALAKALNIGLFRIEVFTFRRVARLTERLVPLYMEQEYDDARPPTRLYTEISTQQYQFPIEDAITIDFIMRKGASFSTVVTLNRDMSACLADPDSELKAQVLTFPGQAVSRADFTIEVIDSTIGQFRLTMDPDSTKNVPTQAYWQMLVTTAQSGGLLLAQGTVKAERPVGQPVYSTGPGGTSSGQLVNPYNPTFTPHTHP